MKRIFEVMAPQATDDLPLDLVQRDARQLLYALKFGRLLGGGRSAMTVRAALRGEFRRT